MDPKEAQAAQANEQPQAGAQQLAGAQAAPAQSQTTPDKTEPQDVSALPAWAQELVKDLRKENASHRKAKSDVEAQAREAEEKRLKEQGQWQAVAEKAQAQLKAAQAELDALKLNEQRREIAKKAGLPDALALRLSGSTPEEMEADAKALVAALPKATAPAPDINAQASGTKPAKSMTDDERREFAARYGVMAQYIPK